MKTYLLIGGAGFIGSHLAGRLLRQGNKVIIIDRAPCALPSGKAYTIDIDDAKKVDYVFKQEKPHVVFHLAGAINLRKSVTDPLFTKDLSFLSRLDIILGACKNNEVNKFVFVSSGGAIYENAKAVPTKENYPVSPNSLYGLANLMMEKYIQSYCNVHGVNFVIPRLSNVYGPRQWQSGVIPSFIVKTIKKERPVIFGKGTQTRDFIYIDDVVEALLMLARQGKNEAYNVGSSQEISLKKLFALVNVLLGAKMKPAYEKKRFSEAQRSALDISKIKKETGWRPKTSIREGLLKTIHYYTDAKS